MTELQAFVLSLIELALLCGTFSLALGILITLVRRKGEPDGD